MKIFSSIVDWRKERSFVAEENLSLGFVPTMGALHAGHLSLVQASAKENSRTLVSIFVNPMQFNNSEDLNKYPQEIESDLAALQKIGCEYVLLPTPQEMYPNGYCFQVSEKEVSQILEGQFRPGHFVGVLTVMMKLLNIAQANRCYMGEKDFQQLMLVKNMAKDFFIPTEIIGLPTVREESGLAMSSRNLRLSSEAKTKAALIYQTLCQNKEHPAELLAQLKSKDIEIEYLEEKWDRLLTAAYVDGVRLIDNVPLNLDSDEASV